MTPYYQDASVQLFHGDCREILPELSGDFAVITDPPYGIHHSSNYTAPSTTAQWMNREIEGDQDTFLRDLILGQCAEWACFGSIKASKPVGTRGVLIWDKGPASGMGDLSFPWKLSWEMIFVAGKGWAGARHEGVLKGFGIVTRASMGRVHPNEKPVDLLRHLIAKHSAPLIVDPFMGSGSTLRAAKDLGREAIGIEIEERYCEIAANRCRQEVFDFQSIPPVPPVAELEAANDG